MEEVFDDTRDFLDRMIDESSPEEETLKQAGFNHIYNGFIKDIFENSPEDAIRKYAGFEKTAADTSDPFLMGQKEAVEEIEKISSDNRSIGWYKFLKEAHEKDDIINFAKQANEDTIKGDQEVVEGFLEAREDLINSNDNIIKLAFEGPGFLAEDRTSFNESASTYGESKMYDTLTEQEKTASFGTGADMAINDLSEYIGSGDLGATVDAVSATLNSDMGKHASEADDMRKLGTDAVCHEFMKTASAVTASYEFDNDYQILDKVAELMFDPGAELEATEAYWIGKEAALDEIAELGDEGYSVGEITQHVSNSVNSGIDKRASEEDLDYRRGIDAGCHQFLKSASEIYGNYDVSGADDYEILHATFEKIAEDEEGEGGPGRIRRAWDTVSGAVGDYAKSRKEDPKRAAGDALATYGAIRGGQTAYKKGKGALEKRRRRKAQKQGGGQAVKTASKKEKSGGGEGEEAGYKQKAKDLYGKAKDHAGPLTVKNVARRGAQASGVAHGIKDLRNLGAAAKRKLRQRKMDKQGSLTQNSRVAETLDYLQSEGLV